MVRKFHLKKDYYLIFFFSCLAVSILILNGCLFLLKYISQLQIESANERYKSFRIANELIKTSDDLTKMVRLYVVTGDPKYRKYYNEILSIRAGKSPRPEKYDEVYWNLVINSKRPRPYKEKKSLVQKMIEHGFSLKEFELLKDAESKSNNLTLLEIRAMNAVEGKYSDENNQYSVERKPDKALAIKLVFGAGYIKTKAEIMKPIQEFLTLVDRRTTTKTQEFSRLVTMVITIAILLSLFATIAMVISIIKSISFMNKAAKENEMLILNVLPISVAGRLKGGEKIIADTFPQASVLFSDISGFTEMTKKLGTAKMVDYLGQLFDEFDELTSIYGVEKIKTIGDNYMAVAGVPEPNADHANRLADFALAIRDKVKEFSQKHHIKLTMRIGMTYGAVIAGVIGHKKFVYDVWGEVVNVASRMESSGIAGEIQITEKMAYLLEDHYIIEDPKEIEIKGIGKMKTFLLKGKKSHLKHES